MLKIMKYLTKKDWCFAVISLFFIVLGVYFELKVPEYMEQITMLVQTNGSTVNEVATVGISMLMMALFGLLTSLVVGFLVGKISANLSKTLRSAVYKKTISFSKEETTRFSIPSLITRSTNDITQVQTFVTLGLQATVTAPIMATWAISKIIGKNFYWTMATAISILLLLVVFAAMAILVLPKFAKIQKLTDDINRVSRESITGVRAIRASSAENYQENKFSKINSDLTKENLFTNRTFSFLEPAMSLIMMLLSLSIYLIGAYAINGVAVSDRLALFSEMIVFSSYAMLVVMPFIMLAMSFVILPRAIISAKRINEVLETESKIVYGDFEDINGLEKGELVFKNVSFKYPDAEEYALKDISFEAKKGETIAFIGATGSGKSTLIDLIPRLYDATEGEILINGYNVKDYTKESLCQKLGYVSQKAVLFSDTVSGNISYGDDMTEEDKQRIIESSEIAMAYEFINKMDNTYDADISQGGTNISGGQKQRLSIARAIYKRPEIYIFDDSFSALDFKTDRILRSNIKKYFSHVTTLIVAQRVGTIMDADKIIVLDDGEMVGMGTHKSLLETCKEYREIAQSQLSEEELKNA